VTELKIIKSDTSAISKLRKTRTRGIKNLAGNVASTSSVHASPSETHDVQSEYADGEKSKQEVIQVLPASEDTPDHHQDEQEMAVEETPTKRKGRQTYIFTDPQ
jgi:hypothetical protein